MNCNFYWCHIQKYFSGTVKIVGHAVKIVGHAINIVGHVVKIVEHAVKLDSPGRPGRSAQGCKDGLS